MAPSALRPLQTAAILIAILGITDQPAGKDPQRGTATGPAATFNGAKAATDQPADQAANRPRTLIEGGVAVAVSGATGEQAAQQQHRQDGP